MKRGLTERKPRHVEAGKESFKVMKLTDLGSIEAFLMRFERAVQVHGREPEKHAAIQALQLTGRVCIHVFGMD